jgi:hypothetical protein
MVPRFSMEQASPQCPWLLGVSNMFYSLHIAFPNRDRLKGYILNLKEEEHSKAIFIPSFAKHQVSRSLVRDRRRKQQVKQKIVRPQTSRRPFRQVGRLEAVCRTNSSGFCNSFCVSTLLRLVHLHSSWSGFTTHK